MMLFHLFQIIKMLFIKHNSNTQVNIVIHMKHCILQGPRTPFQYLQQLAMLCTLLMLDWYKTRVL